MMQRTSFLESRHGGIVAALLWVTFVVLWSSPWKFQERNVYVRKAVVHQDAHDKQSLFSDMSHAINTGISSSSSSSSSSSCAYREYPWPAISTGLPHLADVFASADAQWVYFVGVQRMRCSPEHSFEIDNQVKEQDYLCAFDDGTYVISEPFTFKDFVGLAYFMRCRIPNSIRPLVKAQDARQTETYLHVDLHALQPVQGDAFFDWRNHATDRRAAGDLVFTPEIVSYLPKLHRLPICHAMSLASPESTTLNFSLQNKTVLATRLKSEYVDNITRKRAASKAPSTIDAGLINAWIDYHRRVMGIDHFIIYDNDEVEGPVKQALEPHVKEGTVTRVWFPMADCKYNPPKIGMSYLYNGQNAAMLSAYYRFGTAFKWFGNADVDEYFVLLDENGSGLRNPNTLSFLDGLDEKYDAVLFQPFQMGPCNGDSLVDEKPRWTQWRCFSGQHYAKQKNFYRTSRVAMFSTHMPKRDIEGKRPTMYYVPENQGLLSHYRNDPSRSSCHLNFTGIVKDGYNNQMAFMDSYK